MIKDPTNIIVDSIRVWSEKTKKNAHGTADNVIEYIRKLQSPAQVLSAYHKAAVALANTVVVTLDKIVISGTTQDQVHTLIKNCITDAANRANEAGNIIQQLGHDEDFASAAEKWVDARNEFDTKLVAVCKEDDVNTDTGADTDLD